MSTTNQYFPFGTVPALSQPPVTYDIVMDKSFPRIGFFPTEQGGVYQEIVEVLGDLWIVTNATWDNSLQGFYQEQSSLVNCNASTPAFAWVQRGNAGDAIRMYGAATGNSATPVVWVPIFDAGPLGTSVSPLTQTVPGPAAFAVNSVMNGASSTLLNAFQVNVTLNGGSSLSAVEQINVNGTPVWQIDTTGTLRVGIISSLTLSPPVYTTLTAGTGIAPIGNPPSATIGLAHQDYVDLPNAQTITGQKTIQSLTQVIFGGGWGNITGGTGDDYYLCSGSNITALSPLTAKARSDKSVILAFKLPPVGTGGKTTPIAIFIDNGLQSGNTFTPTLSMQIDTGGNLTLLQGGINAGSDSTITGKLTVTGAASFQNNLTVQGNVVLGTPATILSLMNYFEGNPNFPTNSKHQQGAGLIITQDPNNNLIMLDTSNLALIGSGTTGGSATGLTSLDGSITITKNAGTTQNVDFSALSGTANFAKGDNPTLDGNGNITDSLQVGPLPAGKWYIEAIAAGCGLKSGGNMSLGVQGAVMHLAQQDSDRTLYVYNTVQSNGNTQPTANFNVVSGQPPLGGGGPISFTLKAIRIG